MKQKIFVILMLIVLVLGLTGCRKPNFGVRVDKDLNVEITAENASRDMTGAAGSFEVAEGQKLYVEPALKKGEIGVKITAGSLGIDASVEELKDAVSGSGAVLEFTVSGKEPVEFEIEPGEYGVTATVLSKAEGTVVIKVH